GPITVRRVPSGIVWSTRPVVPGSARTLAPWPPVPKTSTRSAADAAVGETGVVDVAGTDATDGDGVGVATDVGVMADVGVVAGAAVLLGVTVGVGSDRRAVDTIQPVASPSRTLRQSRPSASRSVPTTTTSVPSRTDFTTGELVPGSTRMLTAWLPP